MQIIDNAKEKMEVGEDGDVGDEQIKRGFNLKPLDPFPDVEWWDAFFLPEGKKEFPGVIKDENLFLERVTHFVIHPVQLKNDYVENINNMTIPIHLT